MKGIVARESNEARRIEREERIYESSEFRIALRYFFVSADRFSRRLITLYEATFVPRRNEKAAEQKRTAASVKPVGDRRNKSAKPKFDNTGIP